MSYKRKLISFDWAIKRILRSNDKNEIILIEIQYSSELDYLQRILYVSSKTIAEHMKEGQAFSKVSKVISISIKVLQIS